MLRTIALKLLPTLEEMPLFKNLQQEFSLACNAIVPYVIEHRCWNRVALHAMSYNKIRQGFRLGSQMTCNAIFAVCKAYKAQQALGRIAKDRAVPQISFRHASVHFDKRTYTFVSSHQLSLYTLSGRIKVVFKMGSYQKKLFDMGKPKEAELVYRDGDWYFNLVIEIPDTPKIEQGIVMGVDVGENNLAATSTGKIFGGGKLRDRRDRFLAQRRRLQSNGTQSSKQKLCKVSGRETRHVAHVNHEVSAEIIAEAKRAGAALIVLEDLTDIRERIRAKKRERTRLHRWPFRELQQFIQYKAENVGIAVEYVSPAYSRFTLNLLF
jgi:putative transposase